MRHRHDHHPYRQLQEQIALRHRQRPAKRLRYQLFMSFGFAILVTMMTSALVFAFFWHAHAPGRLIRPLVFFASGLMLWIFSGALAHRLAWPLWELTRAVKDFGAGKMDRRAQLPRRSPLEVAELAGSFNDMAARVEALVRGQRELLGAVSHELRTPLARLRVLVALLQEKEGDPALAAKFEREIVEMDALVGELLAEARISAGALTWRAIDLKDLVDECAERLGVTLAEPVASARVNGDTTLVARAITLMIDNAQKHGGQNIRVRTEPSEEWLRVIVEDDGPGFDAQDLPKLFDAFTRGRGAVADEKRGVGLGLYLVRRVAEAHGGSASAENRPEGGARVSCVLPRAGSTPPQRKLE